MPVTAKLSRKFYETFGDEVVNELVDWLNLMDTTYRGELRELNELNYARFKADVDRRFAEADAKLEQAKTLMITELREFQTQVVRQFGRTETQMAELKAELHASQLTQSRWLIGLWATAILAVLGLYLR